MISASGIIIDLAKVETVLQWEHLKIVIEIRSFFGIAGYYQRFIKGFSKIVALLTQFSHKGQPFAWTKDCELSFHELKCRLTISLVLILCAKP